MSRLAAVLPGRVLRTIRRRGLASRGDRVLLAVSGGPDSLAMLDLMHRIGPRLALTLHVATVDHGLRASAAEEARSVESAARARGLGCAILRVDVTEGDASLQGRARRARYEALLAEAGRVGASRVAVGHTLDDQAETVLARILRGAGLEGLSGIRPRRADGVIRPLIDVERSAISAYLAARGLVPVEDPSNRDARFERARLRHEVVPRLREEDPAFARHLAALADEAREVVAAREREASIWLERGRLGANAVALEVIREAPPHVVPSVLTGFAAEVTGRPPGRASREALVGLIDGPGEVRLAGGWIVDRSEDRLVVTHDPERPTRSRRSPAEESARAPLRPARNASDR